MSDDTSTTTAGISDATIVVFVNGEQITGESVCTVQRIRFMRERLLEHRPRYTVDPRDLVIPTVALELERIDRMGRDLLHRHALPRAAQLELLERLAVEGRRITSPLEIARHGWADAPRRPCYRARRTR